MAKKKRKSGKGRGLGEIKRTGRRRTQAQKAAGRVSRHHIARERTIPVRATITRDTGAIGSRREGDFHAQVCIPSANSNPKGFSKGAHRRRMRLKKGYHGRCGDGGGRTPTAALRAAFKNIGKNLE